MTDKLELKSSHEVVYTVDVADVESIFYCKPTDPDILTVLMKDGKKLYCDEVCPVDSMQEEPVSEDLMEATNNYCVNARKGYPRVKDETDRYICNAFKAGAKWQKTKLMKDATEVTVHIDAGGYPYTPEIELYDYDKDVPLAKEGDKYKVILIKEE